MSYNQECKDFFTFQYVYLFPWGWKLAETRSDNFRYSFTLFYTILEHSRGGGGQQNGLQPKQFKSKRSSLLFKIV